MSLNCSLHDIVIKSLGQSAFCCWMTRHRFFRWCTFQFHGCTGRCLICWFCWPTFRVWGYSFKFVRNQSFSIVVDQLCLCLPDLGVVSADWSHCMLCSLGTNLVQVSQLPPHRSMVGVCLWVQVSGILSLLLRTLWAALTPSYHPDSLISVSFPQCFVVPNLGMFSVEQVTRCYGVDIL